MRILLSVCLGLLFASSLSAQYYNKNDKLIVGLNGGMVKPLGDFADESKLGIDLSLNAKLLLNPKIAVGLSLGYMDLGHNDDFWAGDSRVKNTVNYQVVPILSKLTIWILDPMHRLALVILYIEVMLNRHLPIPIIPSNQNTQYPRTRLD